MLRASEKLVRRASVLVTVLAAVALPAVSGAATVRVEEEPGDGAFSSANKAHLVFTAGPGESNGLVISVAAIEGDNLKLQVIDTGAAVEAGAKCSGGGAPSVPVSCSIHKPKAPDLQIIGGKVLQPIPNTGWDDDFAVDLGDGNNSFDASGVAAGGLPSDQVDMTVTGGPGDDTILTGGGRDTIDPGRGRDSVHAGGEYDRVLATDTADGADVYDLGTGVGELNYGRRTEPVFFDGRNAGAENEGDLVVSPAPYVVGGSGDDRLAGPEPGGETFDGGPGDDVMIGGVGNDELLGGLGDDRLSGGNGDDLLVGDPGDDLLDGGEGDDRLFETWTRIAPDYSAPHPGPAGPSGDDVAFGRGGDDRLLLAAGADRGIGGIGNDRIYGRAGPDRLRGGGGADLLDCGSSRDRARADREDRIRSCEVISGLPKKTRR